MVKIKLFSYLLRTFLLLSVLLLPVQLTDGNEMVIPTASITVDGNADDWNGFKPIMTDPEGDSANVQGSDLKALYALNDSNFLYLMLEVYNNPNGSRGSVQYVFEVTNNVDSPFLKWDYEIGAEAQGNTWLWNLTEYDTRANYKDLNPYGRSLRPQGVEAVGKAVFEMKIPLYIIGNPKNMIIRARTQPQGGGDFYDDMPGAKFITKPSIIFLKNKHQILRSHQRMAKN